MIAHFLRHGESASNAAPGRDLSDLTGDRLTELGRRQAQEAAAGLGCLRLTRLWSSPMRRALETAEPIAAALGLEIEVVSELHELRQADGFGELSGEEQRLRRWSTAMAAHAEDPGYAPPGAESFDDLGARVATVKRALERTGDERVLAVSHGIFLRFFAVSSFLGEEFRPAIAPRLWQLRSLNCGLSAFEHRDPGDPLDPAAGPWRVLSWMGRPWDPP